MQRRIYEGVISVAIFVGAISFTVLHFRAYPVYAKGGGSCTISGTTYEGTCVDEEAGCGCSTADGTELGPSPDCTCSDDPPKDPGGPVPVDPAPSDSLR